LKYNLEIQKELIDVCASLNGINLTLDVGVDNTRHGLPFGTPWSLADIRNYMQPKIALWKIPKNKIEFLIYNHNFPCYD
jgi:hypothetical protein